MSLEHQQLDEQIILFAKTLFQSFDETIARFKKSVEYSFILEELASQGYDGTIQSVLYNDDFWDVTTYNFIQRRIISTCFLKYNEKNDNIVYKIAVNIIPSMFNDSLFSVMNYSYCVFISRWNKYYKHEIRTWAESEFGICLK